MIFRLFFTFVTSREVFGIKTIESLSCNTNQHETTNGPVCGGIEITENGFSFKSFQGLPFAAPPLGDLRFRKPVDPDPWTDVLDLSSRNEKMCIQEDHFNGQPIAGQEDCLFLNVYVPLVENQSNSESEIPLPVMVWIYGGGFDSGSGTWSDYGPQKFMETQNVVLVTINYRLGVLGWLTLDTDNVEGNQGLYDMVAGLQWVQDNIENFGGDPSQVTIFGESAGSWASSYLMVSPLAKGLFSRAILQSGAWTHPNTPLISKDEAIKVGEYGAEKINCLKEDSLETLQCLQNVDVSTLIKLWQNSFFRPPSVVIDGKIISEHPQDTISSGNLNAKEIIFGANKDEGLLHTGSFLVDQSLYAATREYFDIIGPVAIFGKRFQENVTDITEQDIEQAYQVLEYYVGDLENINEEHFENITSMFTHEYFYCTHSFSEMLTEHGVTVFQYLFTYKGVNGYLDFLGVDSQQYGVCHSDELYLMWNPYWFENYSLNEEDMAMGHKIVKYWVNFASTGDPSPPDSNLPVWSPVSLQNHQYLNIKNEPTMETLTKEYLEMIKFWKDLMSQRPLP